jgi:hypothetical protein
MSDGGPGRALLEVEMSKSSQEWSVQRSAVRSIAWLDLKLAGLEGEASGWADHNIATSYVSQLLTLWLPS